MTPAGLSLREVLAVFRNWLYLPDTDAVVAVLGAVAANFLDGDPVWLLVVGPPGGGKSEILQSVAGLEGVHRAATLTEAALLSGSPKKDHGATSTGGLLRTIGESGILLCKDFGSVFSMNRDARASVLAALREIYDGSWTRLLGTDGGKTLHWEGRVGLLAGCTQTVDRYHAVMGAMGERFALYRLPVLDADEHALRSLQHAGRERSMRDELREAVNDLIVSLDWSGAPAALTPREDLALVALAVLATRCRSAVERDGRDREIELIPDAEAPTRLVVQLARLLAGLRQIGADEIQAWRIVRKVALDSIPDLRRDVLARIAEDDQTTASMAATCGYPTTTVRRCCEDLCAHGIITRLAGGPGNADIWTATAWLGQRWDVVSRLGEASVPETSADAPLLETEIVVRDFSGTLAREAAQVKLPFSAADVSRA
jgi:hypothetical protein